MKQIVRVAYYNPVQSTDCSLGQCNVRANILAIRSVIQSAKRIHPYIHCLSFQQRSLASYIPGRR